jgi:hypothetical protein
VTLLPLLTTERAKCGHYASKSYIDEHGGLCRKCHSNFAAILQLEKTRGEDALVEYWYSMILANLPEDREQLSCLISHLVGFYEQKLIESPSRQKYIAKMLYMLRSIEKPFDAEQLR